MNIVCWGVIGCSDIVERRAGAAIVEQENSRLIAFLSRNIERADAFSKKFGAENAYDDLQTFLQDERIDIVYVATEIERHAGLAIAAMNAGKHVLVEKPMALTTEQCFSMIEAAEKNEVNLSVAYYARFFEKARVMKKVIEEGGLGKVVRANIRVMDYYNPSPSDPKSWRVTDKAGGNRLADIGSHRLDMLSYFLGRPVKVCGFFDRLSMSYEAADTETALVQFENGVHVTVLANANVPNPGGGTSVEIYGTQG
ncbi:MAG: Gfo/Idh/MocA family protein, partial [Candidatus Poribacteria bacterium]